MARKAPREGYNPVVNRISSIVCWSATAGAGVAVGTLMSKFAPAEINSGVLTAIGGIGAVASALFWAALRKLDELKTVSGLEEPWLGRVARKVEARRGVIWRRWIGSIVFAIITAAAGQTVKAKAAAALVPTITCVGYGGAFLLALIGGLLAIELQTLSRLGSDIKDQVTRDARAAEFLRNVRT